MRRLSMDVSYLVFDFYSFTMFKIQALGVVGDEKDGLTLFA